MTESSERCDERVRGGASACERFEGCGGERTDERAEELVRDAGVYRRRHAAGERRGRDGALPKILINKHVLLGIIHKLCTYINTRFAWAALRRQ